VTDALPVADPLGRNSAPELAVLRDKAQAMFAYNDVSLVANLVGAVILVSMFAAVSSVAKLTAWGGLFALLWTARGLLARAYARSRPDSAAQYRRWLLRWNAGTLLSGAMWGLAAWIFWDDGKAPQQVALVLIIYSYCVACVPILAPQFPYFLAYLTLQLLPLTARVAMPGTALDLQLAGAMMLTLGLTIFFGSSYRTAFNKVVHLKLRTALLLDQLRDEKAVSDVARQAAEVANRAKTQFFAAASHDLRQPLHAVSLFAEALRQRSEDDEVIKLVNSINASIYALDGLFSELLDITRIDAGGVEVKPVDFAIAEIYRKLRLHFEPAAFEKGLALRFRGEHQHVHADPLLVERILRNLVSNAIRYTNDGGILVSCRRRGDRLRIQVWDTGRGIGEQEQQRVFEEFYQPGNTAALAPDQKKGLGLGLAIVKRLASLMNAPLSLQSVPGRGTVFTLEVSVGKAVPATEISAVAKAPVNLTLGGKVIVVVEDEPAVRSGLEILLKDWGAQVLSFDTVAASTQWACRVDSILGAPHLLIVDYRLENGHTGVEAIHALRAFFGRSLPAIMITGSTMTGHDAEAEQHDFHLLIKPVVPHKLRAVIAFKLSLR